MTQITIEDAVPITETTTAAELLDDLIDRPDGWWIALPRPEGRCLARYMDQTAGEALTLRAASEQPVAAWLLNEHDWLPSVSARLVEFEQDAVDELNKYNGKHSLVLLADELPKSVVSVETSSAEPIDGDLRWLTHMPNDPMEFLRREILHGTRPELRTAVTLDVDPYGEDTALPNELRNGEVRLGIRAENAHLVDAVTGSSAGSQLFSEPASITSLPELRVRVAPDEAATSCTIEVALVHRTSDEEPWRLIQTSDPAEPDRRRNTLTLRFKVLSVADIKGPRPATRLIERARIVTQVRAPKPVVSLRFSQPEADQRFALTWKAESAERHCKVPLTAAQLSTVSEGEQGSTYLDLMGRLAELGDSYELDALEELSNGDELLREFAVLGTKLHRLVFGTIPRPTQEMSDLGTFLAQLDEKTIEFEGLLRLPWRLFYDADYGLETDSAKARRHDPDTNLDVANPNGFWGARFRIEEATPRVGIEKRPAGTGWTLPTDARGIGFVHPSIGASKHEAVVAANDKLFERSDIAIERGAILADWLRSSPVSDEATHDLVYYFGHGKGARRHKPNGVAISYEATDQAKLDLGGEVVSVTEMEALRYSPLAGHPLLFLNACETLHRDMAFTNPFVDFFYRDLLARAIIGCVSPVPAHFAVQFAQRLLDAFGAGDAQLGDCLQYVTRDLLNNHQNPFGLIYTIAGHSEVHIQRLD